MIEGRPYRDVEFGGVGGFLRRRQRIGYTEEPGREDRDLRRQIARTYQGTTGIGVDPEIVFVGTDAAELMSQVLQATVPEGGTVLYSTRNWHRFEATRRSLTGIHHLRAGDSLEEIARAMDEQRPSVVIFNLTIQERENYEGLSRIAEIARAKGIRLVTAGLFQRQPTAGDYPIARLLREMPEIAQDLIVVNDLTRRYTLATSRLSYAIVPDREVYQAMARLGEVTYSRASTVGQAALIHLLRRLKARPGPTTVSLGPVTGDRERIPVRLLGLGRFPTFAPKSRSHRDPIRLDFGESESETPVEIVRAAREIARNPAAPELEEEALAAAADYLRESRGIEGIRVVAGPGVLPLQFATLRAIARMTDVAGGQRRPARSGGAPLAPSYTRHPVVLTPRPLYDVHRPMILAAGGVPVVLRTDDTLLEAERLEGWTRVEPTILMLTQPTNPGGQYYPSDALLRLAERSRQMTLLSDEVFGRLAFDGSPGLVSPQSLPPEGPHWNRVVTFFGLSKEFAAPGLRAGFAATTDPELAEAIRAELLTPPDRLALAASIAAFRDWRPMIENHLRFLAPRRAALEQFLAEAGLPFLPAQGGFGTLVDFSPVYGRRFKGTEITRANLAQLLDEGAGITIHPPGWGDTEQVRLVYAIRRIDEAITRLRRFLRSLS